MLRKSRVRALARAASTLAVTLIAARSVLAATSHSNDSPADVVINSAVSFPRDTTVNSLVIQNGGTLSADGVVTVLTNMTVQSGGVVTHAARDTAGLRLNVTGTLTVAANGLIDLNAVGLLGGSSTTSTGWSGETYNASDQIIAGASGFGSGWGSAAGASYGGVGTNTTYGVASTSNPAYGLLENPRHLGSGGGGAYGASERDGGNGGGRARIQAGTLQLDGVLRANGAMGWGANTSYPWYSGGGSGGGIRLDVGTLSGSGQIQALGAAGTAANGAGAGGGGRIAIYYDVMTLPDTSVVAAGGSGQPGASAGTVYLKANAQSAGDLFIDDDSAAGWYDTPLKTTLATLRSLTVRKHGRLVVLGSDVAALLVATPVHVLGGGALTLGSGAAVTVTAGAGYELDVRGASSMTLASGSTLGGGGGALETNFEGGDTLTVAAGATFGVTQLRLNGASTVATSSVDLNFPVASNLEISGGARLNLRNGAKLSVASFDATNVQAGTLDIATGCRLDVAANALTVGAGVTLVKDGGFGASDQLQTMTVQSGGVVTHAARDTAGLRLNVTGTLTVAANGLIDLNAVGLLGGSSTTSTGWSGETYNASDQIIAGASGFGSGWGSAAGASYGGVGTNTTYGVASTSNPAYGLLENPRHLGSGGGGAYGASERDGGNGGGRARIQAGTLQLDGVLRANGAMGWGANTSYPWYSGGGSGGGIRLDVGTLSGSGQIQALGAAGTAANGAGAGGGGRIAIYYDVMTLPDTSVVAAGGSGQPGASAGTVYLKANAQSAGDLFIDDDSAAGWYDTPLKTTLATLRSLTVRKHGRLVVLGSDVAALLVATPVHVLGGGALTLGSGAAVTVTAGAGYELDVRGASSMTLASGSTLGGGGGALETNFEGGDTLTVAAGATFGVTQLRLNGASTVATSSVDLNFPVASNLEISGGARLNLRNGAKLSVASFDATNVQAGTLDIATGCRLDVAANALTVGAGVTLVKDGGFGASDQLQTMTVQSGGVVTHAARDTAGLRLNVTGTLTVAANGLVDLNALGLRGGSSGSGWYGETYNASDQIVSGASGIAWNGWGSAAGASYGGVGTSTTYGTVTQPNAVYGLVENPRHLGSGGGGAGGAGERDGGNGGGRARIQAGTLQLDGVLRANGAMGWGANTSYPWYSGGGSGGGIRLDVGTLSGTGQIQAIGAAGTAANGAGAGGGGRIAIYYGTLSLPVGNVVATGGSGLPGASPGSIYLKASAQSAGDLVIDDGAISNSLATPLKTSLATLRNLTVRNNSPLTIASSDVASLTVQQPIAVVANSPVTLGSGVMLAVTNASGFDVSIGTGATLTMASNTSLAIDALQVSGTLVTDGVIGAGNQLASLTVTSGGLITQAARDTAGLTLNVSGLLDLQNGGAIDVSAKGLLGGYNGSSFGSSGEALDPTSFAIVSGATYGTNRPAGGSYGGLGAAGAGTPNPVYGAIAYPASVGAGGAGASSSAAGGNGGGRVAITAGTLALNGALRANGGNGVSSGSVAGGGGAGGAIRVSAGTLSGTGAIQANGGSGVAASNGTSGGGGGGRLAVNYCSSTFPAGNVTAAGTGPSPGQSGSVLVSQSTFTITASAGGHGSVSPAGAVVVACGATQSFTIAPDIGCHVVDVLVDGTSVGALTAYTFTNASASHTLAASFAINTYAITASAGAHGSIAPAGVSVVPWGGSQAYAITPDPGYVGLDVLVDGNSVGPVTSYTFAAVSAPHTIAASFQVGTQVVPGPAPSCISNTTPCITVPVMFHRAEVNPARALGAILQLSGNLRLCDPAVPAHSIHQGPWLAGYNSTFEIGDLGGGRYEVDQSILGMPCGITIDGVAFTLDLTNAGSDGTGTVTVTEVVARDCDNGMLPGAPGPVLSITIDRTTPAAISALAATQVKSGNDADGTTKIRLAWPAVDSACTVNVYRKGFGGYPDYDDAGGSAPASPATPAAALAAGWTLTPVVASGNTDEPAARDFFYYVAFVSDPCGNVSAVSNRTGGTLDYHLGDFSNGVAACSGDNLVNTADVSLFGYHYGASLPIGDALECIDIGPTTTNGVDGRPLTDHRVNFEDLMVLAMNFTLVSAPAAAANPVTTAGTSLVLDAPPQVAAGERVAVRLSIAGDGSVQGLSAQLAWDPQRVVPDGVEPGAALAAQNAVAFSPADGAVDAAVLGRGRGFRGEVPIATLWFRALASGSPGFSVASLQSRDVSNQPARAQLVTLRPPAMPATTSLSAPGPNPVREATTFELALARDGVVDLAVYSVTGQRVRTLMHGAHDAGYHHVVWDGRGDDGHRLPQGIYFARMTASGARVVRTVVLAR